MAELPRPGVEVIQEFSTTSPTVITPTLVPFVTGPAKEIVEFTDSDGLINEDAKQGSYTQLPQVISQSAFPSPRGNIQEVNVEEATIEMALLFGGSLSQLDRDPGSAFLTAHNEARRAAIRTAEISAAGLALDGLTLVFAIDQEARLNTLEDVAVTFSGSGNLSAQQIADQINSAYGSTIATLINFGATDRVQIASPIWGAASSVTIRAGGSANELLGATGGLDNATEYRVEGAGFHAEDQADNTTLSAFIVWSQGQRLEDGTSVSFATAPTSELSMGQLSVDADGDSVFEEALAPDITFTGVGSIDLQVGDYFYADGVRPNSTAEVSRVESTRFKLGIVNTALSTFDDDGNVLSAVRDDSKVNTLLAGVAFAPRYAWFRARNISEDNVAATAATLTGSIGGAPAELATITSSGLGGGPFALAGLTLVTQVTVDGVQQDENTFTFTGGPFADVDAVVTAIGTNIPGVVPTNDGGELALSTANTGDDQSLQLKASSSALALLFLTAGTATGKDVEFVDIAAVLTGGTQTFPFNETTGETLIIEGSDDGGDTWAAFSRTFTSPSTGSAFADISALLTFLNTAGSWDGGTLPTEFTISNNGDQLVITSAATGSTAAIRIGAASTAVGATANTDLLYTVGDSDVGEENLSGTIFKFRMNDRPQIYTAVFTSDSLDDAVAEINDTVGFTIASIGGGLEDRLVLTSPLEGAASSLEIVDDGTNNLAMSALGLSTGNTTASGSGRPNADFQVDSSGNVLVGAEILRSAVTGDPFGNALADLYIQYTALRLDLSPQAAEAGLLSLSDVDTLQTVLNPINSANPLGLAMFFQLINAPGIACKGMGVSATSAASPEGTLIAYTEVADFIESEEVYAIAPLTHDDLVFQMFRTHVDFMSGAEQKGERILLQNPNVPTRRLSTVVASGLSADTTATQNELVLDVNPSQGLVDNDINPAEPIDLDDDVYVELIVATGATQELRRYSVAAVNGTLVTFRTTFATGENTDAFYTTTPLTETLVNADWSMQVRGAPLLITGSTLPDKDAIAETVAAYNAAISNRRVFSFFPDQVVAAVGGIEEALPLYYYCSAVSGLIAGQAPQQGFTNLAVTGFTGVVGSNDRFSTRQLNLMAGGGTYVVVQDAEGSPVISRHQLSTDLTSIETRELSITKVVDFVAKFMRAGLRNFIGTFNITQPFLDTLSTVIQGMLQFLAEGGVILGGDLNNLVQDKDEPDTVLVDVTLDVPFPANYIRLTLVI
jgi:hypothetical protein